MAKVSGRYGHACLYVSLSKVPVLLVGRATQHEATQRRTGTQAGQQYHRIEYNKTYKAPYVASESKMRLFAYMAYNAKHKWLSS